MTFPAFQRFVERSPALPEPALIIRRDEQRGDYEAGVAQIGAEQWRIRTARSTPTRPGAFVAVWQRGDDGATRPCTVEESRAGLLVFVEQQDRFGVFVFTTAALLSLGYVSSARHPGKRGFRVYPPWCRHLNSQATRTQRAQAAAFRELPATTAGGSIPGGLAVTPRGMTKGRACDGLCEIDLRC